MADRAFDVFYNEVAHPETARIIADGLGAAFRLRALTDDSAQEELAHCRDADFILAGWRPLGTASIESATRLRAVHKLGAGVDKIDLAAAARRGIQVTAGNGVNATQVAEHTIALMLALLRRVREGDHAVRAGGWPKNELRPRLRDLGGAAVTVVGMGSIGEAVARRLHAFGCVLRYHDVRRRPELERELGLSFGSVHEVLKDADIVTLHVPLNSATAGLIGEAELALLPPTALLVNTCRGAVVDERALVAALSEQRLAGAGLDVLGEEPPPPTHPLLTMDQVLLTPHVAGGSRENIARLAAQARAVLDAHLCGQPPPADVAIVTPTTEERQVPDAARR